MILSAEGSFDIKITPQSGAAIDPTIARYNLDKQYHGDLEAAGKGEFLSSGDPASGFAGYVAMERVTGSLHGRSGSFALQHMGSMEGGKAQMNVAVVPGTGTGDLAGIAGALTIVVADGKHTYKLEYSLPATP